MPGARERIKRRVPGPALERLRRWRHLAAATVAGGELARVQAEMTELVDARTRDLLARSDEVLSSYDRRVAAVATRLLDLEDRVAAGGAVVAGADAVVGGHVEVPPLLLDHRLAAELAQSGRGTPEAEQVRLGTYVALLGDCQPVLVLGCGRGDLLAVLGQGGVEAAGVDDNPVLVDAARQAGLDAAAEDLFVHLARRPEASVSSVTLIGVLERLRADQAARLVRSAARVVVPGGTVLVETPDPSTEDGRAAQWRDALCVRLYAPATLEALCRDAGFEVTSVEAAPRSSPAQAATDGADASGAGCYTLLARRR